MTWPSYFSKHQKLCLMLFIVSLLAAVLLGCLQNYARFSKDAQVSAAFRSGSVPLELNYFYAGNEGTPYAIMGISPDYKNSSSLWIPFEPQPEYLLKITSNLYGRDRNVPYGYNILSPDGEFVGIWFSSIHFPIVKVDQQSQTIKVRYGNPEVYREY